MYMDYTKIRIVGKQRGWRGKEVERIELSFPDSKSDVLPLHHTPKCPQRMLSLGFEPKSLD